MLNCLAARTMILAGHLAIGLAGCAGQAAPPPLAASAVAPPVATGATYQLSKAELGYNCRTITGHMKVRILQMRKMMNRRKTSVLSRGLQSATTPIAGGSRYGANPDADLVRDRAKLEAYNRLLAKKKCKTLDLDAELSGSS